MIRVLFRILLIKQFVSINSTQAFENHKPFLLQSISKFGIEKEIQNTDLKKATTKNTISPKILKVICNAFAETLQNLFNECLITDDFPDNLKPADTTPVFKKKDLFLEDLYRWICPKHSTQKTMTS